MKSNRQNRTEINTFLSSERCLDSRLWSILRITEQLFPLAAKRSFFLVTVRTHIYALKVWDLHSHHSFASMLADYHIDVILKVLTHWEKATQHEHANGLIANLSYTHQVCLNVHLKFAQKMKFVSLSVAPVR